MARGAYPGRPKEHGCFEEPKPPAQPSNLAQDDLSQGNMGLSVGLTRCEQAAQDRAPVPFTFSLWLIDLREHPKEGAIWS